jgi:hypothetical protein
MERTDGGLIGSGEYAPFPVWIDDVAHAGHDDEGSIEKRRVK